LTVYVVVLRRPCAACAITHDFDRLWRTGLEGPVTCRWYRRLTDPSRLACWCTRAPQGDGNACLRTSSWSPS